MEDNQHKNSDIEKKDNNTIASTANHANTTATTNKSVCDKTEDDVGDEMPEARQCDGQCNTIYELTDIVSMDCGHFYCQPCSKSILKDDHNEEKCKNINSITSVCPIVSPSETAYHDGSLSKATNDRPSDLKELVLSNPQKRPHTKKTSKKTAKNQKVWYTFLHENKPLAVCMNQDSSFGDLLRRIALCLNVNQETHDVVLKIQESSSNDSEEELGSDLPPVGVIESSAKLTNVRLPKTKLLLVEIVEKGQEKKDDPQSPNHQHSPNQNNSTEKETEKK